MNMLSLKRTRFVLFILLIVIAVRSIIFFLLGETVVDSFLLMVIIACFVAVILAFIWDIFKSRS